VSHLLPAKYNTNCRERATLSAPWFQPDDGVFDSRSARGCVATPTRLRATYSHTHPMCLCHQAV